jgi:phosphatidate cytidylyltransferase
MVDSQPAPEDHDATDNSELIKRVVSTIVLVPLALAGVYLGGYVFLAFALIIGVLIAWEWSHIVLDKSPYRSALILAFFVVFLGMLVFAGSLQYAILSAPLFMLVVFLNAPKGKQWWMVAGLAYAALPVMGLILLRKDPIFGLAAVMVIFLLVWACDTAAYFTGRAIGGPKLSPGISPGKTWAGFVGGVTASGLVGISAGFLVAPASPLMLGSFAAFLGAVSQGGDLVESAIKRYFGIKDSGNLIPGHGGILDRLDGVIAAVVVACLIGMAKLGPQGAAKGVLIW